MSSSPTHPYHPVYLRADAFKLSIRVPFSWKLSDTPTNTALAQVHKTSTFPSDDQLVLSLLNVQEAFPRLQRWLSSPTFPLISRCISSLISSSIEPWCPLSSDSPLAKGTGYKLIHNTVKRPLLRSHVPHPIRWQTVCSIFQMLPNPTTLHQLHPQWPPCWS